MNFWNRSIKRNAAHLFASFRQKQVENLVQKPFFHQSQLINQLGSKARFTVFGKEHYFREIHHYEQFKQAVPVRNYEDLKPYIDRAVNGEANVLWPDRPLYFAKTSGTTSGAKYIPMTRESIPTHIIAARDVLLHYIHQTKKSAFLDGKMMFMSGSPNLEYLDCGIPVGRLSGIVHHYVPSFLHKNRVPTHKTNCIEDWENKVDKMILEIKKQDLRLISGIPPWIQMFFEKLKQATGKMPTQVWPNLDLFVQGGVDFNAYKNIFFEFLGKKLDILEVFPASEGFFAYQNDINDDSLLLLMDNGVFYEFIPLDEYFESNRTRIHLKDVKLGVNYAMVISTNAGLWAYDIGDTVKFTSLEPFKVKVTGRVTHFISAFGEHVIETEINTSIAKAAEKNKVSIVEFTVAPYIGDTSYHEWFIEFVNQPEEIADFQLELDNTLCQINSYYNDLRRGGMLSLPKITPLRSNACREYMKSIGKLGGQNKFIRLSNNRVLAEALAQYIIA